MYNTQQGAQLSSLVYTYGLLLLFPPFLCSLFSSSSFTDTHTHTHVFFSLFDGCLLNCVKSLAVKIHIPQALCPAQPTKSEESFTLTHSLLLVCWLFQATSNSSWSTRARRSRSKWSTTPGGGSDSSLFLLLLLSLSASVSSVSSVRWHDTFLH